MPFIPHSEEDIASMLEVINSKKNSKNPSQNLEDLFSEIPENLRVQKFQKIPEGLTEQEISRLMLERAAQDGYGMDLNFIGAGAYQHHIPWAVWDLVSRGEFMTSYTPYQAEASQGNLQLIYEYQSMMASLMAMDCANASMYEGASCLAEAVLMAARCNKNGNKNFNKNSDENNGHVLVLGDINPRYKEVLESLVAHQKIRISYLNSEQVKNINNLKIWENLSLNLTAVVIPQPSFLGNIQAVDDLVNWAHEENSNKKKLLVIGLVNPIAMSLLKPPGQWGSGDLNNIGADIVCGEGQSLGVPLASGGPYFGFMCCKKEWVRQMPGRIVGRTVDAEGKEGFCLTLQAREQHIRRAKATSNICTNQGLLVTAATIYMALMGLNGLAQVAKKSHRNAVSLKNKLQELDGVKIISQGPIFHEFVIQISQNNITVSKILEKMASQGIQAGFDLGHGQLLICSTEVHTPADHDRYVNALSYLLHESQLERALSQESVLC